MSELYCEKMDRLAVEKLQKHLAMPVATDPLDNGCEGFFDPWEIFPAFYGSYNGEFDELAIRVLTEIRDRVFCHDLAGEMFREYLCVNNLCDYGSSPRGCFPTMRFAPLLPELIEKWKAYSAMQWSEKE